MYDSNQIQLFSFQKARILSSSSEKKRFKPLFLEADEAKDLFNFSTTPVGKLSENELIRFQKLYCKSQIFNSINSGKFSATLQFNSEIHPQIREWLKSYGYFLSPDKPINYDLSWLEEIKHPTPESKTSFNLLW